MPAQAQSATTYYIDCKGSNQANGTSEATAWATPGKTRRANLNPGDSLLLKRGCVFKNDSRLFAKWAGTAENPITIGAYGEGERPLLMNGKVDTVHITGSHLIIQDLAVDSEPVEFAQCSGQFGTGMTPVGTYYGFNITQGASHITLQRSIAQRQTAGLHLSKTALHNHTIINNEFVNNNVMQKPFGLDLGAWGILIRTDDTEVAYNYFNNNVADCGDGVNPFIDSNSVELYEGSRNLIHHNVAENDRVFSEMGSSSKVIAEDNYYGFNVVVSNLKGARFVTTRGERDEDFGPVNGTILENNTVIYTGGTSEAFVCGLGCNDEVIEVRNNVFETVGKSFFADEPIEMANNLLWNSSTNGTITVQDANGRRRIRSGFTSEPFEVTDPLFTTVDGEPWHLSADSPAVDGVDSETRFDFDIDEEPPAGSAQDMGASEFRPQSATSETTTTTTTTTVPETTTTTTVAPPVTRITDTTTTTTTAPPDTAPPTTAAPEPVTATTIAAVADNVTIDPPRSEAGVPLITSVVDGESGVTVSWEGGEPNTVFRIRYRVGRSTWSKKVYTREFSTVLDLDPDRRYQIQVGARIGGRWPALYHSAFIDL